MKLTLITLLIMTLTIILVNAATLIIEQNSPYITTSVYYDGSQYHYEYHADSKINNREISNLTIDLCDSDTIYDIYGDDSFKVEYRENSIKFDNLSPKGNEFIFGFFSKNSPEYEDVLIKASNKTYINQILSPSCHIPEPNILSLVFGFLILSKRRR